MPGSTDQVETSLPPAIRAENERDRRQLAHLETPLGFPGSGMVRYGAAMHFFMAGKMSADLLEAYRICCKLDSEDPFEVWRARGGKKGGGGGSPRAGIARGQGGSQG